MGTKTCSRCWDEKPLTEFHRNARTSDGLQYYCKDCMRWARRAWYCERHPDPKGLRQFKPYREAEPGKYAAHQEVLRAVQRGDLSRANTLPCVHCGARAQLYHHPSYAEDARLSVRALCAPCHAAVHQVTDAVTSTAKRVT